MLGWLKRKIEVASYKSAKEDIERFYDIIKSMSDEELALLLVNAGSILLTIKKFSNEGDELGKQVLSILDTGVETKENCMAGFYLNKMIKNFQYEGDPLYASATMLWLHTVRCYGIREILYIGKNIWHELKRGYPQLQNIPLNNESMRNEIIQQCMFIPPFMNE